jgi:hypothetical protein
MSLDEKFDPSTALGKEARAALCMELQKTHPHLLELLSLAERMEEPHLKMMLETFVMLELSGMLKEAMARTSGEWRACLIKALARCIAAVKSGPAGATDKDSFAA